MLASQTDILEGVLDTVLAETDEIAALVGLALEERAALVASEYDQIARLSDAMTVRADTMAALERRRDELLRELALPDATLDELRLLADRLGVEGFGEARESLRRQVAELQQVQESNARLLLSAMKLHEKWMAMFAALAFPTYDAGGQQESRAGRPMLSRTA